MRKILHVDLNSFYASVECLLDESVAGLPVAVTGSVSDRHGVVLAKNELAKKFGVKTGMTAWQAKKLVPNIVLKQTNFAAYIKYSRAVRQLLLEYTDFVEPFGIDESWLDISNCRRHGGSAVLIAEEIRQRVKTEIGLTVSIGVSFNKVFAKLGSDMKKPDAITVISEENFKQKIYPLPVDTLLYVGRSTKNKLEKLTIKTIGDLAKADEKFLVEHLGKWGATLGSYARGEDNSPVRNYEDVDEYKSIGNSLTFYRDLDSDLDVETLLLLLSESVCSRMKDYGFVYARTVSLWVVSDKLVSLQRSKTMKSPTNLSGEVAGVAMKIFKENYDFSSKVRGLGVSLSNFTSERQLDFCDDQKKLEKQEKLEDTIEYLRKRYGGNAIARAVVLREKKFAELDIKDSHSLGSLGKKK